MKIAMRFLVVLAVLPGLLVLPAASGVARESRSQQRAERRDDGGLRWRSRLALGPSDVRALAVRGSIVLAAGRSHFKTETYPEVSEVPRPSPRVAGIFRSVDEGDTWRRAVIATNDRGAKRKVISRTPDLLALGASSGQPGYAVFDDELWRSNDAGISWRAVGDVPDVTTTITILHANRVVLGLARGGLIATANDGKRWKPYGKGLPKQDGEMSARVNDVEVAGDVMLVATDAGLYRKPLAQNDFERAMVGMEEEDDAQPRVTAVASHGGVAYATTARKNPIVGFFPHVYRSTDGAATWTSMGSLSPRDTATAEVIPGGLVVGIRDGSPRLFATTNQGFVQTVNGVTPPVEWRRIVRPFGEPFTNVEPPRYAAIAVGPAAGQSGDDNVYFGIQRASLGVSGPGGNRLATPGWFDEINGGRICGGLHIHATTGDLVIACGRHVFRSADRGATWRDASAGLPWGMVPPEADGQAHTSVISDRPLGELVQTADGSTWTTMWNQGLFRSDADVSTWQKVPFPGTSTIAAEPHPSDPETLYAAGGAHGSGSNAVWRTRDAGGTWEPVFATHGGVMTVDVADHDPERILITTHKHGIYVSHDGGATFMPATGIGSLVDPVSMVQGGYSPADRKADVAWALSWTEEGSALYRSDDGGLTWSSAGTLPIHPSSGGLYLSPWDKDTLYAQDAVRGTLVSRDGGVSHCYLNRGVYAHEYVVGKTEDGATVTAWSTYSSLLAFGKRKGQLYVANGHLGSAEHRPSQWVLEGIDDPSVCGKDVIPPKP